MINDLYVDRNVADRIQHFTASQETALLDKLECLRIEPIKNSEPVPEAPDLRVAQLGKFRVIFTYREADHIVMVTDLDDVATPAAAYGRETISA